MQEESRAGNERRRSRRERSIALRMVGIARESKEKIRELRSFQIVEIEAWKMSLVMIDSGGRAWEANEGLACNQPATAPRELGGFEMNLLAKKHQIAEEKLHSKNKWSWDSRPELQRTHVAGVESPQRLSLSLVGSLSRNASQEQKAKRGTASLNQTTLLQETNGNWVRSCSHVALAENIREKMPAALRHM